LFSCIIVDLLYEVDGVCCIRSFFYQAEDGIRG